METIAAKRLPSPRVEPVRNLGPIFSNPFISLPLSLDLFIFLFVQFNISFIEKSIHNKNINCSCKCLERILAAIIFNPEYEARKLCVSHDIKGIVTDGIDCCQISSKPVHVCDISPRSPGFHELVTYIVPNAYNGIHSVSVYTYSRARKGERNNEKP